MTIVPPYRRRQRVRLLVLAVVLPVCIAADGEPDGELWSLRPLVRPAPVPDLVRGQPALSDIDRWIHARLRSAGITPNGPADRRALIRRVTFDLTGLPPSVADVERFVRDERPDTFERVVDDLLASPAFGERWGRHWLDVARFSESVGGGRAHIFDQAWRYRDYVIGAFNHDRPYDRFLTEQIAGDLLPGKEKGERRQETARARRGPTPGPWLRTPSSIIATGFLQLGPKNLDDQNKEKLDLDVADELLDTIGQAVMGLTLGCARCHDHKFDPIPMRDYYALAGIFTSTHLLNHANVSEPISVPLVPDAYAGSVEEIESIGEMLRVAGEEEKALRSHVRVLEERLARAVTLDDESAEYSGHWKQSNNTPGYFGSGYRYSQSHGASATYRLPIASSGRYGLSISFAPHPNRATNARVRITQGQAQHEYRLDQRGNQLAEVGAHFVSLGEHELSNDDPLVVEIIASDVDGTVIADAVRIHRTDAGPRDPDDERLRAELAKAQREWLQSKEQLRELTRRQNVYKGFTRVLAVRDAVATGDTPLRERGAPGAHGDLVPRGFLSCIAVAHTPIPADVSGRLQLAKWLTHPDHPLTARVFVNRVWKHLIGEGIVRSVDNFGARGETPTHPELLDHLALGFIEDGWSTKRLVRRIVLSETYRRSIVHDDASHAADPENLLLWRAHRKRLDAESLRDAMLAAGRALDRTIGGPTIGDAGASEFGYHLTYHSTRRSVYLPVFRNSLPNVFEVFDFADPNLVCGRRNRSVLPTQALYVLNSPRVLGMARDAAATLLASPGDDLSYIDAAYRTALARAPNEAEKRLALHYLRDERAAGASDLVCYEGLFHVLFGSLDFRFLH